MAISSDGPYFQWPGVAEAIQKAEEEHKLKERAEAEQLKAMAITRAQRMMQQAQTTNVDSRAHAAELALQRAEVSLKNLKRDHAALKDAIRADLQRARSQCEGGPDCAPDTPCADCPNNGLAKTMGVIVQQALRDAS